MPFQTLTLCLSVLYYFSSLCYLSLFYSLSLILSLFLLNSGLVYKIGPQVQMCQGGSSLQGDQMV